MFLPLTITEAEQETLTNLDDYKGKVNKCVQALVILGQERTVIKKADLSKIAFSGTIHFRTAAALIVKANIKLNNIFGMRLYELSDKARYLLVNSESSFADNFNDDPGANKELAVLYFILMGIFVSPDQRLTFEEIEKSVKQPMSLSNDQMKEYLDTFMKKLYIKLERHQEIKLYGWGERATAEIDPENFFKRFLDLADDSSDRAWPELRKRIEALKEARMGSSDDNELVLTG